MKQQSKILIFSLLAGIGTGALGISFIDFGVIQGLIGALLSGVFIWFVLSKVEKSDSYPYWVG